VIAELSRMSVSISAIAAARPPGGMPKYFETIRSPSNSEMPRRMPADRIALWWSISVL
jgi:hypothetical protein